MVTRVYYMSATNRGRKRVFRDRYYTPHWAINQLLQYLVIPSNTRFLEPCLGDGTIYEAVPAARKNWCEIDRGVDYLTTQFPKKSFDLIITNPPYSLTIPFLNKSLAEGKTVIYLLGLSILGSKKRRDFWRAYPPTHLLVLSKRPSFNNTALKPGSTDAENYGWFAWDQAGMIKIENTWLWSI